MKGILGVIIILALALLGQVADATYLDSSWNAQLTNVQTYGSNYSEYFFYGGAHSSPHITVGVNSSTATFSIPRSGDAPTGERASWGNSLLAEDHTMGSISFDYATYWTQPNLTLELWAYYLMPWQPESSVVWSSSWTGQSFGHVTINNNPNGYYFQLVVVPEPAGLLSLSMLCGTGGLLGLRLRTLRRRAK